MHTTFRRTPFPVISAAANREERDAQIKSIQDRVERIRRAHQQITADVNLLTEDVRGLTRDGGGPVTVPPPAKEHT